ncbi:transcriptional regulator [Novosphingobium sp. Leaf2]|uniref:transcriptional regulator n=1 Tax=Novosphingobium sp. Leaf2 TaxID=1735670 RepID=UPI0009E79895|nr:YdaS family helix-turn-helix protein [Novosphingobium sp. Leaf2]
MSSAPTPYEALSEAVEIAGSQSALARICGVGQPAVWKWVQSSKRIPAEYVLRVEAATGVSRHHLRPDIYPVEMPEASSRWSGVDHCAGSRRNGIDGRAAPVAVNRRQILNGARA